MSDGWTPRIVVFQCQYTLFSPTDQWWMDTQLPPYIKLVQVPCSGRISPLFVLNAIQGGADGVLINGCVPGKCHFKEGNLAAHRQLGEFKNLLTYVGMQEERMRFTWIDVDGLGRIQRELADLEKTIQAVGPAERLVTRVPLHV